jgi:uncharacterized protein (TIGR00299 family) protein
MPGAYSAGFVLICTLKRDPLPHGSTQKEMKICYFDAFSGISGDMTVGALLDAGADWTALKRSLESLNLAATFRLERVKRHGLSAAKFSVDAGEQKSHRHLSQIEKIIQAGEIPENARRRALQVFRALAEAEARCHDVPIERVHFHEVGAVDSICDIIGACVALELLGIREIRASRVNVGSGTVATAHGVLPVPAPATALLLKDRPVFSAGPEAELTTPTGAALLSALAAGFGPPPPMRVHAQGFGAGDKDFSNQANVLRVLAGEAEEAEESINVSIIEANIDDSTPQMLGYAMERLFEAGALDVTFTPALMKKNRPGTLVSVISLPERTEELTAVLFSETTTLGVRVARAERRVMARKVADVETPFGRIRVKYASETSFAPEYDDCRQAARLHKRPLRDIMEAARAAFRQQNIENE